LSLNPKEQRPVTENQQRPDPSRICHLEPQEVAVADFPASGLILDIGGGGEGIIGRSKGDQVIAIDRIKRELEEAPAGPLKIVMNAGDLQFLDASFATATAFFSLMFMPAAEHSTVFGEVFRVLAPGGRFLIWDIALPPRLDDPRDILLFKLMVSVSGVLVDTGYGTFWPAVAQDLEHYMRLAVQAGFEVEAQRETGRLFFLEVRRRADQTEQGTPNGPHAGN
jgi:SAM-dependent methyltransferase